MKLFSGSTSDTQSDATPSRYQPRFSNLATPVALTYRLLSWSVYIGAALVGCPPSPRSAPHPIRANVLSMGCRRSDGLVWNGFSDAEETALKRVALTPISMMTLKPLPTTSTTFHGPSFFAWTSQDPIPCR